MEKERTVATNEADAAIEAEIAHLRADEYVRLAKRYEYARTRRKQYLYQLRYYQKKGRELAATLTRCCVARKRRDPCRN